MTSPQDLAKALISYPYWQTIRQHWNNGEPYRVALGALLSGDPQTAGKVIEQQFAGMTPQDIQNGVMNVGLGMAPIGMTAKLGPFKGLIDRTRSIDISGNDLFAQHASMPQRAAVAHDINMTVSPIADGKYVLQYRPLWGSSSKEFHIIGDDPNALALAGIDRLTRSDRSIAAAQKSAFDNSLLGKLQAEYGDTFSTTNSTQSKSAYIIHNPTGTKIRISDHDLPLHYEQPDVDLRTNQPLDEKLQAIKDAIRGKD
jgi:hypothetical protein